MPGVWQRAKEKAKVMNIMFFGWVGQQALQNGKKRREGSYNDVAGCVGLLRREAQRKVREDRTLQMGQQRDVPRQQAHLRLV